jgi:hypothetical protein
MWSLVFYLSLEKVWNYRLLSTPWYYAQPLLLRLVVMQVRGLSRAVMGALLPRVLMGILLPKVLMEV